MVDGRWGRAPEAHELQATVLGTNPVVTGCGYAAGTTATAWLGATGPAASGTGIQAVIEVVG